MIDDEHKYKLSIIIKEITIRRAPTKPDALQALLKAIKLLLSLFIIIIIIIVIIIIIIIIIIIFLIIVQLPIIILEYSPQCSP